MSPSAVRMMISEIDEKAEQIVHLQSEVDHLRDADKQLAVTTAELLSTRARAADGALMGVALDVLLLIAGLCLAQAISAPRDASNYNSVMALGACGILLVVLAFGLRGWEVHRWRAK